MSSGNKITLVTGATGFLGRRLCQRLQNEGELIRAVGRRSQDGPWSEFVEIDFVEDRIPEDCLNNVGTIYHLASKAHAIAETPDDSNRYHPVIVVGTRKLIGAAERSGVNRFAFFSSVKSMGEGNPTELPIEEIDETWTHDPQSPYGQAKAEAETIVRQSSLEHVVILRPVMVFGPGEKGNLPRMIEAVKKGRFPPIPENGNKRSMIHVDDLIEFAIRSIQDPIAAGKTYILSSKSPISTRALYNAIRESLGLPSQDWSIPMFLLKSSAFAGSIIGSLIRKRMPLDMETLKKLTGSAWYSSKLAQGELNYCPKHEVDRWLIDQG